MSETADELRWFVGRLSFPRRWEEAFLAYRFERSLPFTRLTLGLSVLLYATFGLLDVWMIPNSLGVSWTIRYLVFCPLAIWVLKRTWSPGFRAESQRLLLLLTMLAGLGIVGIIAIASDPGARGYYAGLMLVQFTAYTLLQLRFWNAVVVCTVPLIVYEFQTVALQTFPPEVILNNTFFFVSANALGILAGLFIERALRKDFIQLQLIEVAQKQSETLLLNLLPRPIAERIKRGEDNLVDQFDDVTVLFADLVGFTTLTESIAPSKLIQLLTLLFTAFDRLTEKYSLEKIKTIGDAYMVAGGLPFPRENHTRDTVDMALAMLAAAPELERQVGTKIQLRIGVHCGPVLAGVIGVRKFAYDLWGDTVNTASRLESHGVAGRIHISEAVARRLGAEYTLEARGEVQLKGRSAIRTLLVVGKRPAEATDDCGPPPPGRLLVR